MLFHALRNPLGVVPDRIADSSSRNAVSNSSAPTMKGFRRRDARQRNFGSLRSEIAEMVRLTDHHSLITYHSLRVGAVSSVVEHLVYTER